ncbi:hypothetical protein [Crassaminicella profunda]|uniref:hypothetical protein n=1 Tax=Crassaminicella profunda TaxID=1286698 RepID=UPI001CA6BA5C|nr:hypothetical protein [Crassaminicella profunda]QZY54956.1 hypothetical protein K7H06_18355 [Crassaminicella profunda]
MNEDKMIEFLSNLDDDLIEKEVDKLLEGVEIDMDHIKKKACDKLNKSNKKVKRKKRFPYVVAACVCLLSMSIVYADDISQAIKSFMNKTPVYSTIVDGDAYYLKENYPLNKDIQIKSLMFSEGNLEMEITSKLSKDELGEISIIPKNDDHTVYVPGGYSEEGNEYFFSFANKTENNYNIKPVKDFQLIIAGNNYDISLEKAKNLELNKEIYTAENNIKGVNIGAKRFYKNEKLNVQFITSFEDNDLKLNRLGKPTEVKAAFTTENRGSDGIMGSSSSNRVEDLYVLDEMNNKYKLEIPKDSKGRPITIFETNAPKDKNLTLKLPAIIAAYEKTMDSFELNIPKEGELSLNKEVDFNIQKAVLKKIKRTSPTSAQVEFELNTDGNENIHIRSFDFYSHDVKKIAGEFNGDQVIINLEFDKDMDATNVEIAYPEFIMNGNWVINMK